MQSTTLFRKAAGVYHYLAHEILPSLQPALTPEAPPEASSSVSSIMSFICLAEAQVRFHVSSLISFLVVSRNIFIISLKKNAQIVTIMKAEEKQIAVGLLAKLHYGVVQLFDEAKNCFLKSVKECKDLSPSLMVCMSF